MVVEEKKWREGGFECGECGDSLGSWAEYRITLL
jgi:hypothetical protein